MDRRLSNFLSTLASVMLGLMIWTLVLAISNSNSKPLDVTRAGRYTLAEQSKLALDSLPQPVKVYAFVGERERAKTEELLKRYARANAGKFSFDVLDPRKNPGKAKKYQIRFAGEGVVELTPEKPAAEPKEGEEEVAGRTERLSSITEQDITAALLKLQRNQTYKAYFMTGHGERDINQSDAGGFTQLKGDLGKEGFIVDTLSLASSPKIPEDAALIVCAGPIKPLLPGESKVLEEYLSNHGRFLLTTEPETPEQYLQLVARYGIEVKDEIVLDQASSMLNAEPVFSLGLVYDPSHPITRDYKMQTMFELARPVVATSPPPAGVVSTTLVRTSNRPETALVVPSQEVIGKKELRLDPSKVKPASVSLAVAAVKKEAPATATPTPNPDQARIEKETRIVTVGDSDAFSNQLYMINKDFALNTFNWLAANETQISIRPKDPESTPLSLTGGEQSRMMFLLAFLLPGTLVAVGVFNSARRQ